MINAHIIENAPVYRRQFECAKPFRHVVIDGFLDADACESLLRDFPAFDEKAAMDEMGRQGRKAVVERVAKISPFYAAFHSYVGSASFLGAISELTGVPQLIADETLFGGGTHENLHGQGLDVHIDFNIDERRMLHRRLNLLIYLNKEWEERWGGAIELHANPRRPEIDETTSYLPLFNRAIIFETNEYSWHGFERIDLPPEKQHLSRKSFSIYLYTRERPIDEVVAAHTTMYVPRPLPAHLKAGHSLTDGDVRDLEILMKSRDGLLEMYQKLLVEKEERLQSFLRIRQEAGSSRDVVPPPSSSKVVMALAMAAHRLRYRLRSALGR